MQKIASLLAKTICVYAAFIAVAQAAPLHIMLDPGHGGMDTGASRGKLKEKEIALKVAIKLAEKLKEDSRFQVSMTRTTDRKVSLDKRVATAESVHADLFVSIHLNSSPDARVRGTEIYFENQLPADEEALYLVSREHEAGEVTDIKPAAQLKAEPISQKTDLKRILEDLHRNQRIRVAGELSRTLLESWIRNENRAGGEHRLANRTIRQAPFHVISYIEIPSVLVEIGYVSNPVEGPKLAQNDYQDQLASNLYEGLVKYKETMDNSATENLKSQPSTDQNTVQ